VEESVVAETRDCEQCGTSFVPRREHARFCSPACRAAWNREHAGDPQAGTSALRWSITAMSDTTQRLSRVIVRDQPRALAVIGEAVWWVTIVDATLVRHHLDAYDRVLAGQARSERQLTEETLAGLRFVRNLYRSRTLRMICELRFGRVGGLRQDRGSCLSVCCIWS
jgi:hypothetical protein